MFKNTASQTLTVYAFDATTNLPKTGDAANLTAYVAKDGGSLTALGDASATEVDATNGKGYYAFDLTQAETNADKLLFACKSSTANIVVLCVPSVVYTVPAKFTGLVIDAAGLVDANAVKVGPSGSGTAQTARDLGASVLLSAGTGTGQLDFTSGVVKANLAQILGTALTETAGQIAGGFKKFFNIGTPAATMDHLVLVDTVTTLTNAPSDSSGVTTLLSRVPSGIFTGITSLAQWLGLIAGKQTGNATARTELRATGAGSGTFDETTDSQEALRDRGDAAWTTATGFSTLDAAGVRAAVGLASANLDTQLDALPTAAEMADQVWEEAIADHEGTAGSTAEALADAGGSGASAADIADAVLDEALSGHATAGTLGKAVSDTLAAVDTEVAAIKAKTDNLPASPAATGDIPTAAAIADQVWDEARSGHVTSGTFGEGVASVQGAVTGNIGGNLTGSVGSLATQAKADVNAEADAALADAGVTPTVTGRIDAAISTRAPESGGNLAAVKAKTDNLPSDPADESLIIAATDAIAAAIAALNNLSAAQVKAQVVAALTTDTYAEPSSVPASTASIKDMLSILTALALNKQTLGTDGAFALRNRADAATIGTRTDSDDGTTYTRGKVA